MICKTWGEIGFEPGAAGVRSANATSELCSPPYCTTSYNYYSRTQTKVSLTFEIETKNQFISNKLLLFRQLEKSKC